MESIHLTPRELYILINSVKEQIILRLNMEEEARKLQAQEYERRLLSLNHAHEQARQKERDFVERGEHVAQLKDLERRVESNTTALIGFQTIVPRLDALAKWRDEIIGPLGVYAGLPAIAASLDTRMDERGKEVGEVRGRLANMVAWGAGFGFALTILMFLLNWYRGH